MKTLFFILFSFSISQWAMAKNVDTTGALTFLSISKNISKYSALNFYHYDIFNFDKRSLGSKTYDAGLAQTYFQTAFAYQYLPSLNFSLGHIYQRSNPFEKDYQNEHRIFQQALFVMEHFAFNSTHRFRLEERFIEEGSENEFKTRVRYQLGAKIPLRGISLDAGEYYLNTYNEFYFSTTGERNAFFSDDWYYAGLGLSTKELGSFELGPLIQWSRINEEKDTRTHYTLQLGWILKFT